MCFWGPRRTRPAGFVGSVARGATVDLALLRWTHEHGRAYNPTVPGERTKHDHLLQRPGRDRALAGPRVLLGRRRRLPARAGPGVHPVQPEAVVRPVVQP